MWLVCALSVPDWFLTQDHVHLPVIQTSPLPFDEMLALKQAKEHEALLFTSKEAVHYCSSLLSQLDRGKPVFCVGPKTQKTVELYYQGRMERPVSYDQEGLCEILSGTKSLFYPHALSIRPVLALYCQQHHIKLTHFVCYKTQTRPVAMPQGPFEGCFFGSPSCVKAYLELFGHPLPCPILVQGLVTKQVACELLGPSYQIDVLNEKREMIVFDAHN